MATVTKQRCQRIGCDATFTPDDNPEDSCQYHPGFQLEDRFEWNWRRYSRSQSLIIALVFVVMSWTRSILHWLLIDFAVTQPPIFHDGGKEWSCCKQRSHDFSLFLELPGCKTGKHTSEKPQQTKPAPSVQNKPVPLKVAHNAAAASNCNRCRQGFFCSDHVTKLPGTVPASATNVTPVPAVAGKETYVAAPRKTFDLNAKQTCKNKGCGKEFTEKENTDTACSFHPGPAIFHDRSKGWKCCDTHVKEFDEFLQIPPCTRGWHNSNPEGQ